MICDTYSNEHDYQTTEMSQYRQNHASCRRDLRNKIGQNMAENCTIDMRNRLSGMIYSVICDSKLFGIPFVIGEACVAVRAA